MSKRKLLLKLLLLKTLFNAHYTLAQHTVALVLLKSAVFILCFLVTLAVEHTNEHMHMG